MANVLTNADLNGPVKTATIDLLYRLADDALILGHRNSEWTGLGPILEEDIAFSSMAQDKMGHAQALYTMLNELGEAEPNQLAFGRDAAHYRCCSLVSLDCLTDDGTVDAPLSNNPVRDALLARGDWAQSLVRQFFFSEADSTRWSALEKSTYQSLAQLARKLRGELKYHTMHGRMTIKKLAEGTDDSRHRIQSAIDIMFPHALGMFEPTQHDALLAEQGIAPSETELCRQWRTETESLLTTAGLHVPENAKPIYGGRVGKHPVALNNLLDDMQKVFRLAPASAW